MCAHDPPCPSALAPDHAFARVVARQDDLGWSLLCNKVIVFDDAGEILPNGTVVAPQPQLRQPLSPAAARRHRPSVRARGALVSR